MSRSDIPREWLRRQRELRELTRYRTTLVRERTSEVNRLQKVFEGANIKLASVVTEVTGASGHDILVVLVADYTQATELAQLARGRMREKIPALEQALAGQFQAHQQARRHGTGGPRVGLPALESVFLGRPLHPACA